MAELLKHKIEDINSQTFSEFFSVSDLNKYESIYMFSNINYEDKELFNVLKKDLKNQKTLTLIAADANLYNENDKFSKELIEYFKTLGITEFHLIDYRIPSFAAIKHLESSDIIFLMGGNPINQLSFIKEYELDAIIQRFKGVIMGISAGSMNLCKTVYCSKDADIPNTIVYEGIGLVDIVIDPHFDNNNEIQTNEFLNSKLKIIGLPDESYVKYDKYGMQNISGVYYIKENNKISKVE